MLALGFWRAKLKWYGVRPSNSQPDAEDRYEVFGSLRPKQTPCENGGFMNPPNMGIQSPIKLLTSLDGGMYYSILQQRLPNMKGKIPWWQIDAHRILWILVGGAITLLHYRLDAQQLMISLVMAISDSQDHRTVAWALRLPSGKFGGPHLRGKDYRNTRMS